MIATILLIFIGGLVRAAGAGLGCPDWPQCFGMWIPPTTASELPAGYDATLFNPLHTWLEYVNRLVGVVIGLLITATFALSFRYRKEDPVVTITSGIAFVLVLFQGWLGGQVVKSGLEAGMITIHMVVAMLILSVLLFATFRAMNRRLQITISPSVKKKLLWVAGIIFLLTMVQMVLGTQVREQVDIAKNVLNLERENWLESMDVLYAIHRSFSWLLVIATLGLIWLQQRAGVHRRLQLTGWIVTGLILFQMLLGLGMDRLGMPGALQVLHLVSVAILICAEMIYILITRFSQTERTGI